MVDDLTKKERSILSALIAGNNDHQLRSLLLHGDLECSDNFFSALSGLFPSSQSSKSTDAAIKRILNKLVERGFVEKQLECRVGWDGFGYCAPPTRQNGYWITRRGKRLLGLSARGERQSIRVTR